MRIKFKIFLSLFFVLALCFSFSVEASAHEYIDLEGNSYTHDENINVSASAVEIGDEAAMKKFTLHIAAHMNLFQTQDNEELQNVDTAREVTVFLRRARQARSPDGDGVLSHGDIYPISVNSRGTIVSHVRYPELWGSSYDSSEDPLKTLLGPSVPSFAENVSPECEYYRPGGEDGERVACAVKQSGGGSTIIVGFHHALEDRVVRSPDCSKYKLKVTAERVEKETDPEKKRMLLREYVKGVLERFSELVTTLVAGAVSEGINLATPEGIQETLSRIYDETVCAAQGDFKYGSIYPFIMDPERGISIFNGNDFDLTGLSVSLRDPNPIPYDDEGNIEENVLRAFQKVLTNGSGDLADIKNGSNGYVKYHWDDPRTEADNVPDHIEKGVVPGTSVKESYIEVFDVSQGIGPNRFFYVIGSGIYLDSEMMPDDDGCAIAGSGGGTKGAVFSLLLVVSVLFSAVFLRKRVKTEKS